MSTRYHEPVGELSTEAREMHRALASLMEELEAIDWYNQRADVTKDAHLKAIMIHNRDEEIEHAMMSLEWLRRKLPEFDENMRTYLFTSRPIHEIEEGEEEEGDGSASSDTESGSLRIGKFRKEN